MPTVQETIDVAFLSVCPPAEAVNWLRNKRAESGGRGLRYRGSSDFEEHALVSRCDPYIDFGLARFGLNEKVGKVVYERGNAGIRCTMLASFPEGGFGLFGNSFVLSAEAPSSVDELSALATNETLTDSVFEDCFTKSGVFSHLDDEQFQSVLIAAADNVRLHTPYDDTFMDGWADYSYHRIFEQAWRLSETVPNTVRWASVLYHLLYRCQQPSSFDSSSAIGRWRFPITRDRETHDSGFYLRSRLADVLSADTSLLQADDPAVRDSFYKRFNPAQFPDWHKFASYDEAYFLDGALENKRLWQSADNRDLLSTLCWNHPDPNSSLSLPNRYRSVERRMMTAHPEWFSD